MLHARDPDLLAVDHVAVAAAHGGGRDLGGVRAGGGLGHAHGLQAQFAGGDAGQVFALLGVGTVAQQRAHVVDLAVAGTRVATAAVDLFHDDRRFGQAQARAAVFLRDQCRQPAGLGQRADKVLGIAASRTASRMS
ncbi:hypothetical protein G6F50_015947 [Rhizopus delemar]|uniref:Uncharacterized protein n=1 Tax=Rhizopus delemar TaxID=936053 RepID=A0A9P6XW48_9FUNG|nr:hypothetical protein G6F50_015947 [Rhizopus delemar]